MISAKVDKYIGVLFTVLAVVILGTTGVEYRVSTITAILGMLTVFSIFKGGIIAGAVSTIIAIAYMYYLKEIHPGVSAFQHLSNQDFMLNIMSILCIVIIVAIIDYRYISYYKRFQETNSYINRANEISEIMISHSTVDGIMTKVHPRLCSLLGYNEEELLGMSTWDITHPDDILREWELTNDIISGNIETFNVEKRLNKQHGGVAWVLCNVSAVKDNHGEIIYLLRYLVNITERKTMEQEIKNQLDFLNKLMDAIPNPIFVKNIKGRQVSINKAFVDYVGRNYNNASYIDILSMVPESEAGEIIQACARAISSSQIQQHNVMFQKVQGEIKHAVINIAPYTDIKEQSAGIIGSITDVTHIVNIEEELRQNEKKYRSLVELSPDAVMIYEGDVITFVNSAGISMFGASEAEEIIGRSIYEFIHPEHRGKVKAQIDSAYANLNRPNIPTEGKIICLDGSKIDVEGVNVGFSNGNGIQVMAVVRDITERKKAEELKKVVEEKERRLAKAREYEKMKNEFFANISHELRTPLNVILGTLQLLELHKDHDNSIHKTDKYTGIMKQNCYRLLRLVNNLIDITKIDEGYYDIKLGCYDIVRIVEDITLSVGEYIRAKGLSLEFDTDVEEKVINFDPDQIERIILNLISNAIKFTKPGGKITVNLKDRGRSIIISVKDTGIGIAEDKQQDIFERFVQADKSLNRNHEGSGIGLSLVKSLVEMHGGTINLISKPGFGSEFIIELPAEVGPICDESEAAATKSANFERIKVEFSDIYS